MDGLHYVSSTLKFCRKCSRTLHVRHFNRNKKMRDGLQAYCRYCSRRRSGIVPLVAEKLCPRCRDVKPAAGFSLSSLTKDRLQKWCRECVNGYSRDNRSHCAQKAREWYRNRNEERRVLDNANRKWRRYGIAELEYTQMLAEQGGVCAICRKRCATGKMLAVDHCHRTDKIRGLLCSACNLMLGNARDSIEIMLSAIAYLKKHGGGDV